MYILGFNCPVITKFSRCPQEKPRRKHPTMWCLQMGHSPVTVHVLLYSLTVNVLYTVHLVRRTRCVGGVRLFEGGTHLTFLAKKRGGGGLIRTFTVGIRSRT